MPDRPSTASPTRPGAHPDASAPEPFAALEPPLAREAEAALRRVRPDDDRSSTAELLGRAVWAAVCEPGDRHAGALIAALGPAAAIALATGGEREVARRLAETPSWGAEFADGAEWPAALARWRPRLDLARAFANCRNAASLGARLVVPGDAAWPAQLDDLEVRAPVVLWVRGRLEALAACERSVSIVGARACTDYGARVAGELAAGAGDAGLAVVSGGAYGIDAAAHRVALASDAVTVAVLAGGVDRLYPASNTGLFERMLDRGALVSELPVGQAPGRWRFIQRNRLIAALSQATVLVEAGARSGALHTARDALELGRGVGAVPGPVTSAASAGCHELIRGGLAELVATPEHLVQLHLEQAGAPGWTEGPAVAVPLYSLDEVRLTPHATRVRDALGARAWRGVDELSRLAGLSEFDTRSALHELHAAELAVGHDGRWRRR